MLIAFLSVKAAEKPTNIGIIRLSVKLQCTSVVQECGKFTRETVTKDVNRCVLLSFQNSLLLVMAGGSLESLPWERSVEKIDEDICGGLKIIMACIFDT